MQRRVLVRARGLAAFRRALVDLARTGEPLWARRRAVIVPTRASAELFRQTLEASAAESGAMSLILPDLLTREQWVLSLHAALRGHGPMLSRTEREVLLERAARETAARRRLGGRVFELRPGLVAAMLDFYDELKRRQRNVRRFVGAVFRELGVEGGTDRGSESLIRQTSYLGFTFLAYERRVATSARLDEHRLRARLLSEQPTLPFDHSIIAVADHPSDPRGLWPADFDLIGRLSGLSRIDVVVTDEAHDAGFRERLERELPGVEEERAPDRPTRPVLLSPARVETALPVFMSRDREEELRAVARAVRTGAEGAGGELKESVGIVFQRPLPYLYLAQQVLTDARVPYQAFDALPLAAEPYAALLDLVLAMARTGGTREAAIALLRTSLMRFVSDGRRVGADAVSALDGILGERRATGDARSYAAEVRAFSGSIRGRRAVQDAALRAADAAAAIHAALDSFSSGPRASVQIEAIATFLRQHERQPRERDAWGERHLRARAAVLDVLDGLAAAFARHDDEHRDADALTAAIHHAIEGRTFTPRRGHAGVHLVDAVGARFGEFDHVHIVGLVETDWPERSRGNIFYSTGLLKTLGWPQEPEQMRAEQAAFRDLIQLAARTTRLSGFQLEGDAIVRLSPMVEAVRGVTTVEAPLAPDQRIFADEVVTAAVVPTDLEPEREAWLTLRHGRPSLSNPAYGGFVDPQPAGPYRVSRVDHYVACPFKYFSENVLRLPEERGEMSGLTPLERGTLLHNLFERFYTEWQAEGRGAITAATLPDALARFSSIANEEIERLPESDRALERARLLGSIVATGVAERVFELEADSGLGVRDRWLERDLRGPFSFPILGGLSERTIEIRGKADRIDLLDDGSLRVIDYKLGLLPDPNSSIQIAVYAHCARQLLEAADGRVHPVSQAMYLAFGDDRKLEGRLGSASEPATIAVEARVGEFAKMVERIEAGEFPPRPKRPSECQWCAYAGVCRKEYLVEDDEAADAV